METNAPGLFDAQFYLSAYPDVAAAGVDPFEHYLAFGAFEGRDPNAAFDTSFYLENRPDVAASGENPLLHYVETGAFEDTVNGSGERQTDPNPYFDSAAYLDAFPEILAAGDNPLQHYLQFGEREMTSGNRVDVIAGFDPATYAVENTDVTFAVASGAFANLLGHYVHFGDKEDRIAEGETSDSLVDNLAPNIDSSLTPLNDFFLAVTGEPFPTLTYVGSEDGLAFLGDGEADQFTATLLDDLIFGRGGDDVISGSDGFDFVYGGDGDDTIEGGSGTDALFGGPGNDTLRGDGGVDNFLFGEAGDDVLIGGSGAEVILGGDGDDVLEDGGDVDVVFGGAGADIYVYGPDSEITPLSLVLLEISELIVGFEDGLDRIDLSAFDLSQKSVREITDLFGVSLSGVTEDFFENSGVVALATPGDPFVLVFIDGDNNNDLDASNSDDAVLAILVDAPVSWSDSDFIL